MVDTSNSCIEKKINVQNAFKTRFTCNSFKKLKKDFKIYKYHAEQTSTDLSGIFSFCYTLLHL